MARRLVVLRSGGADGDSDLNVDCGLVKASVVLQRCAFCQHGKGLLLDPSTNRLTLQCSFFEDG